MGGGAIMGKCGAIVVGGRWEGVFDCTGRLRPERCTGVGMGVK